MPKTNRSTVSSQDVWDYLYRSYNLLVASAVLYEYVNNPQAAAIEYLPDIGIHAFEALAPRAWNDIEDVNGFAKFTNALRGYQAGVAFFSERSTVPHLANGIDVFNHVLNINYRK